MKSPGMMNPIIPPMMTPIKIHLPESSINSIKPYRKIYLTFSKRLCECGLSLLQILQELFFVGFIFSLEFFSNIPVSEPPKIPAKKAVIGLINANKGPSREF